jgi:hypothetical protein
MVDVQGLRGLGVMGRYECTTTHNSSLLHTRYHLDALICPTYILLPHAYTHCYPFTSTPHVTYSHIIHSPTPSPTHSLTHSLTHPLTLTLLESDRRQSPKQAQPDDNHFSVECVKIGVLGQGSWGELGKYECMTLHNSSLQHTLCHPDALICPTHYPFPHA